MFRTFLALVWPCFGARAERKHNGEVRISRGRQLLFFFLWAVRKHHDEVKISPCCYHFLQRFHSAPAGSQICPVSCPQHQITEALFRIRSHLTSSFWACSCPSSLRSGADPHHHENVHRILMRWCVPVSADRRTRPVSTYYTKVLGGRPSKGNKPGPTYTH